MVSSIVVGIFVRIIFKNAGSPMQNLDSFRAFAELTLRVSPSMGRKMYRFLKENAGVRVDLCRSGKIRGFGWCEYANLVDYDVKSDDFRALNNKVCMCSRHVCMCACVHVWWRDVMWCDVMWCNVCMYVVYVMCASLHVCVYVCMWCMYCNVMYVMYCDVMWCNVMWWM